MVSIFPTTPIHTPYKDGYRGFTIGLHPLDLSQWLEIDNGFADRLTEKAQLRHAFPNETFASTPSSRDAQAEALNHVWEQLVLNHSQTHQPRNKNLYVTAIDKTISRDLHPNEPLKTASCLVDEDLCIMQHDGNAWVLTAASICFPSHWSLREKFLQPMIAIHAPVPNFADQMASRVNRIMDNLRPAHPVWRMNWSLHDNPALHQTKPSEHLRFAGLRGKEIISAGFVRIERQTLHKLPDTGSILFTIRTHIDPLHSLSPKLRCDLAEAITAMTPKQLEYRGIAHNSPNLIAALRNKVGHQ